MTLDILAEKMWHWSYWKCVKTAARIIYNINYLRKLGKSQATQAYMLRFLSQTIAKKAIVGILPFLTHLSNIKRCCQILCRHLYAGRVWFIEHITLHVSAPLNWKHGSVSYCHYVRCNILLRRTGFFMKMGDVFLLSFIFIIPNKCYTF